MIRAAHAAFAVAAAFVLWRAAIRVAQLAPDEATAMAFPLTVLIATLSGSVAALVAGGALGPDRATWSPSRAFAIDAATIGGVAWWLFVLTLGPWTRELGGVSLVFIAAARLAPGAIAVATMSAPSSLAFIVALGGYGALAAWLPAASLPFGDQIHYLIAAEQLRLGSLEAGGGAELFRSLVGFSPGPADIATHVADAPVGPRPIQGYALQLVLLPGWALAGRLGAHLSMAVVGAWASWQMFLILRDLAVLQTSGPQDRGSLIPPRVAGATWVLATFLAPMAPLATHLYPNMLGAALIATGFRAGFTAHVRQPALAAAVLALTLFLTPRDAVALFLLLPFLLMVRTDRVRVVIAAGTVALVAVALNAVLYGLPLPYAGYAFGTAQAQALTQEPSITPRFWIGLPAILFDTTFGLAGIAPWLFIGLVGLVPLLLRERRLHRSDPDARPVLLPAALTVGVSVLALSFFRLWEGGYAPPGRYFVDVLPLWAPFVAAGLMLAMHRSWAGWLATTYAAIAIFTSALIAVVLGGVPSTALNSAFDHQVRFALAEIIGSLDPFIWLPSFQPTSAEWVTHAYTRLIPAAAGAVALVLIGWRLRGVAMEMAPRAWLLASPAGFIAANLAAVALVLVAAVLRQASPEPLVHAALTWKWVPLALALAAAGSFAVSRAVDPAQRAAFLRRHYFVYLPAVAVLLVRYAGGPDLLNGQLGAIYLAIAVVFAANALVVLWPALDGLGDRRTAFHLAGVALVAFLILLPYDRAIMLTASDEPHYLLIAQSIIRDGDLDLVNDYAGDYSSFYPGRLPDVHAIGVGSALFPIRDLGLPLLAAVPYALAGRVGVLVLMCLAAAALVFQLYLLLRDLRFRPRVAFLAVATTTLAHPILTYTTQIYPELLVALVFVTVARLVRAGPLTTPLQLALASALVGTLPLFSTRAWPIAVGLGLVVAYAALRPAFDGGRFVASRAALRAAAGALPFVALVLALSLLNWRMFGVFLPSAGYYLIRDRQEVLAFAPHVGGIGLVLDRVFGLIPRAPLYLLGFLGAGVLWRKARTGHGPEVAALVLGSGLSFLYIANIAYWWADGGPASRYLVGGIPLFVAAVAGGWEVLLAWSGRLGAALRGIAWGVAGASFAVAYLFGMQPNSRYDIVGEIRETGSSGRFFGFLDEKMGLDPGQLFPSLVRIDTVSIALAIGWTALALVLVWVGRRRAAAS